MTGWQEELYQRRHKNTNRKHFTTQKPHENFTRISKRLTEDGVHHAHHSAALAVTNRIKHLIDLFGVLDWHNHRMRGAQSVQALGGAVTVGGKLLPDLVLCMRDVRGKWRERLENSQKQIKCKW